MDKPYMKVNVLRIEGIKEALLGLSLSYKQDVNRMREIATRLAHKQGGHNKFLESIIFWLDVKAPRYWWAEADTYRISTKQSESTIHVLEKELRELLTLSLRWWKDNVTDERCFIYDYNVFIHNLKEKEFVENISFERATEIVELLKEDAELWQLKSVIPEGWLQRRIWCLSAKTLQNIVIQRRNHKLPHWKIFINEVEKACQDCDTDLRNWIFENKEGN